MVFFFEGHDTYNDMPLLFAAGSMFTQHPEKIKGAHMLASEKKLESPHVGMDFPGEIIAVLSTGHVTALLSVQLIIKSFRRWIKTHLIKVLGKILPTKKCEKTMLNSTNY